MTVSDLPAAFSYQLHQAREFWSTPRRNEELQLTNICLKPDETVIQVTTEKSSATATIVGSNCEITVQSPSAHDWTSDRLVGAELHATTETRASLFAAQSAVTSHEFSLSNDATRTKITIHASGLLSLDKPTSAPTFVTPLTGRVRSGNGNLELTTKEWIRFSRGHLLLHGVRFRHAIIETSRKQQCIVSTPIAPVQLNTAKDLVAIQHALSRDLLALRVVFRSNVTAGSSYLVDSTLQRIGLITLTNHDRREGVSMETRSQRHWNTNALIDLFYRVSAAYPSDESGTLPYGLRVFSDALGHLYADSQISTFLHAAALFSSAILDIDPSPPQIELPSSLDSLSRSVVNHYTARARSVLVATAFERLQMKHDVDAYRMLLLAEGVEPLPDNAERILELRDWLINIALQLLSAAVLSATPAVPDDYSGKMWRAQAENTVELQRRQWPEPPKAPQIRSEVAGQLLNELERVFEWSQGTLEAVAIPQLRASITDEWWYSIFVRAATTAEIQAEIARFTILPDGNVQIVSEDANESIRSAAEAVRVIERLFRSERTQLEIEHVHVRAVKRMKYVQQ